MTWFANLKVRTKVIVAFALVLVVTCGLGLFSLQRLSTANDGVRDVAENRLIATRALGSFSTAAMQYRQVQGSIGLAPTLDLVALESARLEKEVLPRMQAALAEYEPTITAGAERTLFDEVMPLRNNYLTSNDKFIDIARIDRQTASHMTSGT